MKILLVEDDKFLVRVYQAKLKKKGIDSVILEDGNHALETAKREKPDLVVLDIVLPPTKSGYDVLAELKKDEFTKKIPVIILTKLGQSEDRELSIKLGALKHIVKTETTFADVVQLVSEIVEGGARKRGA